MSSTSLADGEGLRALAHPLQVRAATAADADAIAQVHTESWQHAYRGLFPEEYLVSLDWRSRRTFWRNELSAANLPGRVAVLDGGSRGILGFAAAGPARDEDLESGSDELYAIYLDPTVWRMGWGSRLAAEVLEARPTVVWVLADNNRARAFYARMAFRADGAQQEVERGGERRTEIRLRAWPVPSTMSGLTGRARSPTAT